MNEHLLTIVTFLPLIFGLVLLALPNGQKKLHQQFSLAASIIALAVSCLLFTGYSASPAVAGSAFRFFDADAFGIDGLGLLMVLMTTAIFPFAIGISAKNITEKTKSYYFLMLLLETAILGVFDSINLLVFYVFYEAMLIPLYFLIGVWGGANRIKATLKFFLYTMTGSMLMLVAIIYLYQVGGSFNFMELRQSLPAAFAQMPNGHTVELLLFLGFFAAFAVKAPLWPLHSWAPDAYVESPVGVTMILVALKMGLYGFMRFNAALFPNATLECAPYIVTFAVIGVIVAALIASVQPNMKRLVAYSSVSHVGVIVLAIFALTPTSWTGAAIQMISHTFTVGGLFLLLACLYARRKSYEISDYGGVAKVMPFFMAVFVIATLSAIALPGTAGFTGEFLMLIGSFKAFPIATAIAATSAIWSAVYMLWMVKRAMHGSVTKPEVEAMRDLTAGEKFAIVPIVLVILWIGIYSAPLCAKLSDSFSALPGAANQQYPAFCRGDSPVKLADASTLRVK